jgi:hypothetical protein
MNQRRTTPKRRVTACLAGAVVLAGTASALVSAPAQAAVSCSATYTVANAWPGGFQGSVSVRNTGDALTSWTVGFTMPSGASVAQGWGGNWTLGASPTVTSASYNGAVASGGSIELGFLGSGSSIGTASGFRLNGIACGGSGGTTTTSTTSATRTTTTTRSTSTTSTTTTSTTTTSTSGGGTSCGVAPADPQATSAAQHVLCYLYSIYGNHILSGQQESTWVSGPDYEMNYIHNISGKYPAIRGQDMGDSPDFGSRGLAWWNAGGIPMVSYHMGAPNQSVDGYAGSQLTANISAALTSGTSDNATLNTRLTNWANQLKIIQSGGGAVIFRPWHEASGTWFWWSKEGAAQYNRLWIYTYNFMRNAGVHNLVYLHPFNGSPSAAWYPGKQYVDIGGADTYAGDHGPLTSMFNQAKSVYGSTMPIALHENGPIPDPAQLQSTATRWVLFNTWHTTWITDTSKNPTANINSYYNSAYVITRDEVPNLK